jgi:hypothetical protein
LFELIVKSILNKLTIRGDCGAYTFSRTEDMFYFFQISENDFNYEGKQNLSINPGYWSEKLESVDRKNDYHEYDEEQLADYAKSDFDTYWEDKISGIEDEETLAELEQEKEEMWAEIEEDVLGAENEYEAYDRLSRFKSGDFSFEDIQSSFKTYTKSYIWCLYAIVWGVQKYFDYKQKQEAANV